MCRCLWSNLCHSLLGIFPRDTRTFHCLSLEDLMYNPWARTRHMVPTWQRHLGSAISHAQEKEMVLGDYQHCVCHKLVENGKTQTLELYCVYCNSWYKPQRLHFYL
jgi:hypothetical protein